MRSAQEDHWKEVAISDRETKFQLCEHRILALTFMILLIGNKGNIFCFWKGQPNSKESH